MAGLGGNLPSHSGDIGLGGVDGRIRLHDGRNITAISSFEGQIGDFVLYNDSFNATEHGQLDTYLQGNVPSVEGFSDEKLRFRIDNGQGELLTYNKAKTDLMLANLDPLNIRTPADALNAQNALRTASDFINNERSNIGALMSKLEFAGNQVDVFEENTANANSVIADTNIATESTRAINFITQSQLSLTVLAFANDTADQLLNLLEPPVQSA